MNGYHLRKVSRDTEVSCAWSGVWAMYFAPPTTRCSACSGDRRHTSNSRWLEDAPGSACRVCVKQTAVYGQGVGRIVSLLAQGGPYPHDALQVACTHSLMTTTYSGRWSQVHSPFGRTLEPKRYTFSVNSPF